MEYFQHCIHKAGDYILTFLRKSLCAGGKLEEPNSICKCTPESSCNVFFKDKVMHMMDNDLAKEK